jgi:uncharacterized membrane protein YGL010W
MATLFRPAAVLLASYAQYHRDRRNIEMHFFGVPMVVFALGVFLAGPRFGVGGIVLTPAWVAFAIAAVWYLTRGAFRLGAATAIGVGGLIALAHEVSGGPVSGWLAWWGGFLVAGWIVQFVGHYYEGRRRGFVDDMAGLLTAPMFVVLQLLAPLGMFKAIAAEVERNAGPTVIRDLAHPATR